ncbi:MAG: alpha/beta hydrolase [Pseudomonadota bacterium]
MRARFIEIPGNPVPNGGEVVAAPLSDGATMRAGLFPCDNAKGTVIVAPGWSEFIEKYFEVAEDLRALRLNVAVIDWRGQGLSDWPKDWPGYFDRLADDLREFRDTVVAPRFPGPVFLLTHSMGGLPALLLLARGDEGFARAALCAPLTRLFAEPLHAGAGLLAGALSAIGLADRPVRAKDSDAEKFDGNAFTSDPDRHARFKALKAAEPEAAREAPSFGWVRDEVRASKAIHSPDRLAGVKIPTLIISAEAERVVDGADHAAIAAMSPMIEHAVIEGALHEIMMERDEHRAAFWRVVEEFFAPALADGARA